MLFWATVQEPLLLHLGQERLMPWWGWLASLLERGCSPASILS